MRILLVDDDTSGRVNLASFLRRLGHEVIESGSGQDALELLMDDHFKMMMTDIKMPGMTGIELLRTVSSLPCFDHMEVVLFTGHDDVELVVEALRAGAYDYLLKPINIANLVEIIERINQKHTNDGRVIKSVVISSRPLFKAGLITLLTETKNCKVIRDISTMEEDFNNTENSSPDLIIWDANKNCHQSSTLCWQLKKRFPLMSLMVFCSERDKELAVEMLETGADAVISTEADMNEITYAIKKVMQGGKFIHPIFADSLLNKDAKLLKTEPRAFDELTQQEKEVFVRLSRGLTNKQIAQEMYLGDGTVRNYVSSILKKLSLPNRSAAIALGQELKEHINIE